MKRFDNLTCITVFSLLLLLYPSLSSAGGGPGRGIFLARGCNRCHAVSAPAKVPTQKTVLGVKGPDLWYAGSKFNDGFLSTWLQRPAPIRPMKYNSLTEKNPGDHPALGPEEALKVARYLMGLKSPAVRPSGVRPVLDRFGRVVFIKKFACYGCHRVSVRGHAVGGVTGPELIDVWRRLNPDWIYAFLSNPRAFTPVSRMPFYEGLMNDREMRAISAYVAGLK